MMSCLCVLTDESVMSCRVMMSCLCVLTDESVKRESSL